MQNWSKNEKTLLKNAHYTKGEARLILTGKKYGNTTASEIIENNELLLIFLNIDLESNHKNIKKYKNKITRNNDVIWYTKKYKNSKPKKVLSFVSNFNSSTQSILLFVRDKLSSPKYIYYGSVEKIIKIKNWQKENDSFIFKFKTKQPIESKQESIPEEDNYSPEIFNNLLNSVTGARSFKNLIEIGKKGEEWFYNELLKKNSKIYDPKFKLILNNIDPSSDEILWLNQFEESYKAYDFLVNNKKIEVKTSTKNLNTFHISKNEYDLLLKDDLIIVQVLLEPKTYTYIKHRVIFSNEAKHDFNYYPSNYLAIPKHNL